MEFVYCVFRVYGDPDDNTEFHLESVHSTLDKAKTSASLNGCASDIGVSDIVLYVTSRSLYRVAHDSTWWREDPRVRVIERVRLDEVFN